ncbi:hypothetical protein H8356DRAFT_1349252 [Neocallimastix lanati (nom. inval.)]|nr:hypothetical protein H8356DRAFT_1349252 [Neocallimastix sp. JGI-2020a]
MNIDDYDLKEKKEKIYSNSFEVKIENLIKFSQISIDKLHRNNTIKEKLNQITLNLKFLKKLKIQKFKKLKLIILKMIMKIKTIVIDYPFYNLNIPFVTNQLSDEVLNKLHVKGNILNFKPLSLNDLINEFQDSSSKLKHLNKILEPLNSNNLLHIKTDNLLYALSNLDLISDDGTKTELYKTKKIF